jgi:hypothetical protein
VDRSIALPFRDLGARRGWVVSTTPRPLYPRERSGAHCTGSWVGPRAGLDVYEKSHPHRDSIPGPSSPQPVARPPELPGPHIHIPIYITWILIKNKNVMKLVTGFWCDCEKCGTSCPLLDPNFVHVCACCCSCRWMLLSAACDVRITFECWCLTVLKYFECVNFVSLSCCTRGRWT